MKTCSGFTLYELLIALAILSIVATVGTVSLLGMKERSQLAGLANLIKADLNRGRILAARYKGYVVLQIGDGCYELFVDNGAGGGIPGDWLRNGAEVMIGRRQIAPAIRLDSTFPGEHLRWRSGGRIRPGTFTLSHRNGSKIGVVVNAAGRVRLDTAG